MKKFVLVSIALAALSCAGPAQEERNMHELKLERLGELKLSNDINGIRSILQGLIPDEDNGKIYGIDFLSRRLFEIDVESQTIGFISSVGRGSNEFERPIQIAKEGDDLIVYDIGSDRLTVLDGNHNKRFETGGTLEHGVWARGTYGLLINDRFITTIQDPAYLNAFNFESASAISILNIKTGEHKKAGRMPADIDRLDVFLKYPLMALNRDNNGIYYVYYTWPEVQKLDLNTLENKVKSTYKPSFMRERTIEVDFNNPELQTVAFAKKIGEDRTELLTVDFINGFFISTWMNYSKEYFDTWDPADLEYFGVRYDYPGFNNPQEFPLPGLPLGVFDGKIMILENDDPLDFHIGLYGFLTE